MDIHPRQEIIPVPRHGREAVDHLLDDIACQAYSLVTTLWMDAIEYSTMRKSAAHLLFNEDYSMLKWEYYASPIYRDLVVAALDFVPIDPTSLPEKRGELALLVTEGKLSYTHVPNELKDFVFDLRLLHAKPDVILEMNHPSYADVVLVLSKGFGWPNFDKYVAANKRNDLIICIPLWESIGEKDGH